ncbi:phenylacetyl-CoA ligase [Earliella scabrosa]|nr:phenylacetyl-CoA ligase [Earliella scabrosa]
MSLIHSSAPPLVYPRDDLTLPQFILDDVNVHPTRPPRPIGTPCVIDEESGQAIHFDLIKQRTHELATALKGRYDIHPGDVVSLYIPNHVDYPVIVWAVHRLGGVIAAHSPALTHQELVHQLKIAEPSLLIGYPDNMRTALGAMGDIGLSKDRMVLVDGHLAPDTAATSVEDLLQSHRIYDGYVEHRLLGGQAKTTIAFLCFSSGTTGEPKAVCISHHNIICNVVQAATFNRVHESYDSWENRRFRPGDVCTGVLPLYHIYGLVVNLHLVIYAGMALVVAKKFNFDQLLRSIERYRITHLMIVPPQAVLFCKHPSTKKHDLSSVRYCMVAAAPVSAELTAQLLEVFPGVQLGQGYGMTETCAAVSMFPVTQKVGTLGSGGQLVSGTVAKVVKADGTLARVGEPGELFIQGPQVALGYYRNAEATKQTFVDGWIRTGDEVLFRENGDLFVTDRIKELIKVKGHQVAPSELEGLLLNHPDVADAAVIGIPHEYSGEVPLAFVVLKPEVAARDSASLDEVRRSIYEHVSSATSRYKWLDGGITFVDAVPKNASGKILRRVLKERYHQMTMKARL